MMSNTLLGNAFDEIFNTSNAGFAIIAQCPWVHWYSETVQDGIFLNRFPSWMDRCHEIEVFHHGFGGLIDDIFRDLRFDQQDISKSVGHDAVGLICIGVCGKIALGIGGRVGANFSRKRAGYVENSDLVL